MLLPHDSLGGEEEHLLRTISQDNNNEDSKIHHAEDEQKSRNGSTECSDYSDFTYKFLKTLLINVSFLALGVCEAIKGPTILDLQDVYRTDLETISWLFGAECVGSLIGSFGTSFLMTQFPHTHDLLLFFEMAGLAVATAATPIGGGLSNFFTITLFVGIFVAGVHTGGNILCLSIWSGKQSDSDWDSSPHIHSIHFCYALGAFISPLIATNFISERIHGSDTVTESEIDDLYLVIGVGTFLLSLGYLFYGLKDWCSCQGAQQRRKWRASASVDAWKSDLVESPAEAPLPLTGYFLVASFSLFLFCYVGTEYCVGTYLTSYSVGIDLNLSRKDGADVTAVFWGGFSLMRFLAIFAAMAKVRPILVLIFSFALCSLGTLAFFFFGQHSLNALLLCSGLTGFGMGTIFATGLAWLEQYLSISDNWIGCLLVVAGTLGPDMFPLFVGQLLTDAPFILIQLQLGVVCFCIVVFAVAYVAAERLRRRNGVAIKVAISA